MTPLSSRVCPLMGVKARGWIRKPTRDLQVQTVDERYHIFFLFLLLGFANRISIIGITLFLFLNCFVLYL